MKHKVFQVLEHDTLKISDGLKKEHFDALVKYNDKFDSKFFTVQHNKIKFHQYVGVIQVRNITIEVLPKTGNDSNEDKNKWKNLLLTMLKTCRLIKVDSISKAQLKLKSFSLLDIYFDAFLTETEQLVREGLKKRYRSEEGNLKALKGKLLFNKQISKNLVHKERFYTDHKVYDPDNLFNQILLKALLVLNRLYDTGRFTSRIKRLLFDLENISEITVTANTFHHLTFTRNSERYKYAITLAKMIILKYSPGIEGGREDVLAIMFDMNALFEEYVFRLLRKSAQKISKDYSVTRQNTRSFWKTQTIRPDIVIKKDEKTVVVDTKWKVLKNNTPAAGDLRQIFVYNTYFEAKNGILLYPKTENSPDKPANSKYEKPENPDCKQQDHSCRLMFFDLFNENTNIEDFLKNSPLS